MSNQHSTRRTQHNHANKLSHAATTETSNAPTDKRKKVEGDNSVDFPIFEIADSSDDNATTRDNQAEETTISGNDFNLRRSSRNV